MVLAEVNPVLQQDIVIFMYYLMKKIEGNNKYFDLKKLFGIFIDHRMIIIDIIYHQWIILKQYPLLFEYDGNGNVNKEDIPNPTQHQYNHHHIHHHQQQYI